MNCVPPKEMLGVLTPKISECDSFGNTVITEVIELK